MKTAAGGPSAFQRWIPVIKIGVAVGLIGFLLWIVPIRDHLILPGAVPAEDRMLSGSVIDREGAGRLTFETAGDGRVLIVELDAGGGLKDDRIARVVTTDGDSIYVAPLNLKPARQPRVELGILTVIRTANRLFLLLALVLLFLGSLLATLRWHLLLRADNLASSFRRTFDLTFIGLFFNNLMPGLTGGDVVKAVYIARDHPRQKTEAILTVLLDRILGLTGLALVAGLTIPLYPSAFAAVAPWIYGVLLVEAAFCCVFFSRRIRRAIRLDALLGRLPLSGLVKKIDQAAFLYRFRARLVAWNLIMSMGVHLLIISGIGMSGLGMELDVPFLSYYAIVPITLIVMALPIAPSGWGVGEMAVIYFWGTQGVSSGQAFALALIYRMCQLIISLIGGICLISQKDRVSRGEVEEFAHEADRLV